MILKDKRILIVEDNGLIGEVVADMLAEGGSWPIGPALTEAEAMDMINYNPGAPDIAILDLGLDRSSVEVARTLQILEIPFIFATGMPEKIPPEFASVPTCSKPYAIQELFAALERAFVQSRSEPAAPEAVISFPGHPSVN